MKRFTAMIAGALTLAGVAFADEVWTSDAGNIVYETELEEGKIVVFGADGMKMYISGLAGQYSDRGTYTGIWVLEDQALDQPGCEFDIVRPGTDEQVSFWGTLEITFIDPDFPGTWIAYLGECFSPDGQTLIGRPVTATEGAN